MSTLTTHLRELAGPAAADEQEASVLAMVRRYLADARARKATGRLTFELDLQDGGVRDKWAAPRYREK